jgi:hypothetical protein
MIQQTLRRCAAEFHHSGLLHHLATAMASRPCVFSYWIRNGRVPRPKAEWLAARFPGLVDVELLVGERKGPSA